MTIIKPHELTAEEERDLLAYTRDLINENEQAFIDQTTLREGALNTRTTI